LRPALETDLMPITAVNGIDLYYEWHGAPEAPVLVLNNGVLMNAAGSWLPQRDVLAQHFRVLLYDCRGQGRSAHPDAAFDMSTHADDLATLFDALDVRRAHVAGISYGGEVAQAFALQHPARVCSLFLADTVSEVGPELRLIVEGWRAAAVTRDAGLFYLVTAPWNFSPGFMTRHQALLEAARARYGSIDYPAVVRLCDAFLGSVSFTGRLSEIRVPTRIVVGDLDLIKGRAYAEILHQHIAGSELHIIRDAGHATSWEQPAEFNRLLVEFLQGEPADSSQ
jgi:3-oxoadipate enol-lactonase